MDVFHVGRSYGASAQCRLRATSRGNVAPRTHIRKSGKCQVGAEWKGDGTGSSKRCKAGLVKIIVSCVWHSYLVFIVV